MPSSFAQSCNDKSFFYHQVACVVPKKWTRIRNICGLLVSCFGVLIYLFTISYFDYLKSVATNSFVEFDVNTITAGDYTVEFNLD